MNDLRIIKRHTRFGVSLTLQWANPNQPGHYARVGVLSGTEKQARLIEDMLVSGGAHTMPRVTVEVGSPEIRRRVPAFGKI